MSKTSHYIMVNPYVEGHSYTQMIEAKTPQDAANSAWKNISKYIAGDLSKFYITLQRVSSDALHHFKVEEKASKKGGKRKISYSVTPHTLSLSKDALNRFNSQYESAKGKGMMLKNDQQGGGDSDSDDDSPVYKKKKKLRGDMPIVYMWYDPTIYGVPSVYIPSFVSPLYPSLELAFSNLLINPTGGLTSSLILV
jgi:hypothetical protein